MFTPSNMLLKYLNAEPKDMYDIVGALMGYINADPTFKTNDFKAAVDYVLNHGVTREQLFTAFDSELDFEEDSSKWNEEYYSYARVYLKENFCIKRINHVEAIARKLYPVTQTVKPKVTVSSQSTQRATTQGGLQVTGKKHRGQHHSQKETSQSGVSMSVVVGLIAVLVLLVVVAVIVF